MYVTVPPFGSVIEQPFTVHRLPGKPFVVIRGKSGSGKTTVFRILMGHLRGNGFPEVRIKQDTFFPNTNREWIRYLPQVADDALFTEMSVRENIELLSGIFSLAAHKLPLTQKHASRLYLPASSLSGGEKRLLILEIVLASLGCLDGRDRPPYLLLLLDEPFAGLDPASKTYACQLLNAAAKKYENDCSVLFMVIDHEHAKPMNHDSGTNEWQDATDKTEVQLNAGSSLVLLTSERIAV